MVFFSLIFCLFSYVSQDPIKRSFFLIFSLLGLVPAISFGVYVWYSYFICLLFLRGIFVIVVYFSRISSYMKIGVPLGLILFFFSLLLFCSEGLTEGFFLGLNNFYFKIFLDVLVFILFILLYFMNFRSYYLNFSGALRSL